MRWRSNTLNTEARRFALRTEAALLVAAAHLLVRFWLGRILPWALRARTPALQREIRWAIAETGRRMPWRSVCLPDALAGAMMLARRGYRGNIHLGVGWKGDGAMHAHAWLEAGGETLTGAAQRHTVTVIPR